MDIDLHTRDRTGAPLRLRRVRTEELDALVALGKAIVVADVGVVLDPDESSHGRTARRFGKLQEAGHRNALVLGAFSGGVLVGSSDVFRHELRRMQHSGALTMGVHPDWQGRGIGRALLQTALAWADGVGLRRVELNVLAHNSRAVRLYESAGFVLEGTRVGAFVFPDGRLVDDHMMARRRQ